MSWNVADAQKRFRELIRKALEEGPQHVQHRRKDTVVVIASDEYERLSGQRQGFKDYLMRGASFEGLELERDQSPSRDVAL